MQSKEKCTSVGQSPYMEPSEDFNECCYNSIGEDLKKNCFHLPSYILDVVRADEEKFVVFASGLKIGGESTNPLELQLLLDHLTGHLGEEEV
jgi:hypothetical protein